MFYISPKINLSYIKMKNVLKTSHNGNLSEYKTKIPFLGFVKYLHFQGKGHRWYSDYNCVNLTQVSVIRDEGAPMEKMPP